MDDQEIVLKKYKVVGEIFPLNEDGTTQEVALEIGSIQEVPIEVGIGWVEEGLAEEVAEEEDIEAKEEAEAKVAEEDGGTEGTKGNE